MFISNDFKTRSKDRHGDAAKQLDCEEDFNPMRPWEKLICAITFFLHSLMSLIKKNTADAHKSNTNKEEHCIDIFTESDEEAPPWKNSKMTKREWRPFILV